MIISMKIKLYNWLAKDLGKLGREGDTELAHVNPWEKKLLKAVGGSGTINPITNLKEFKGGGGQSQNSSQTLDPNIVPYVKDALSEQQKLYQSGPAEYYPGQTYLNANTQQQGAINNITNQANTGSQILGGANNYANSVMAGDYLQNNPNFNAVMDTAGQAATKQYNNAMQNTNSQASMSGRYGSDAHQRLASDNSSNLATSLANTAGNYSYQNYANERQNQQNVANQAQNFASNNYYDAGQLAQAGNAQAGFNQAQLDADISRYDYGQNAQANSLNNYTNAVWGAPGGSQTTTTSSGGGK
jgi:hypothetical protein